MPARIVTRRSAIHGNGMFAAADIPAGTRLIQYKGKLLTHAESDELYGDGADTGHTFLFSLNDDYVIDANQQGNSARWINHGCAPNCEAWVEGRRIFLYALRDIPQGEELTYDYGFDVDCYQDHPCRCGAPGCVGYIVSRKQWPELQERLRGREGG